MGGTTRQHSGALKLHGHRNSINVRKVLWCCSELGLEVDLVERGTNAYPVGDLEYVALNPLGLVPLLEDGPFRLAESNSIIRYLARREQRTDLYPDDPCDAAKVDQWIDWQATDFNDSWRYAFLALVRKKPNFDDRPSIERSLSAFTDKVRILDRRLAQTRAFVAGPSFTLADIPIGLSLRRWRAMELDQSRLDHVAAYYDRLCSRPDFLAHGGPDSPA